MHQCHVCGRKCGRKTATRSVAGRRVHACAVCGSEHTYLPALELETDPAATGADPNINKEK